MSLRRSGRFERARLALAGAQLVCLFYDPRRFIPTADQRAEGAAFAARLVGLAQPVLIIDHNSWAAIAGLPEFAHGWAVTDVVWGDRGPRGLRFEAEMRSQIAGRRFGAIILDEDRSWFQGDVESHYRKGGEVRAPRPPSGAPRSPRYLYVRPPELVRGRCRDYLEISIRAMPTIATRMAIDHHETCATLFIRLPPPGSTATRSPDGLTVEANYS
jgi:hypothetical protein